MNESFPAKCFKYNKLINRATSGSESSLLISEQFVEIKVPYESTIDNSFHGFANATRRGNMAVISIFKRMSVLLQTLNSPI